MTTSPAIRLTRASCLRTVGLSDVREAKWLFSPRFPQVRGEKQELTPAVEADK